MCQECLLGIHKTQMAEDGTSLTFYGRLASDPEQARWSGKSSLYKVQFTIGPNGPRYRGKDIWNCIKFDESIKVAFEAARDTSIDLAPQVRQYEIVYEYIQQMWSHWCCY